MRKLLVLVSLFICVSSYAAPIAIGIVSASVVVYHNYCIKDLSSSPAITEGHAELVSASHYFDETLILKDSLKTAIRDSIKADTVYHHSFKKAALWSAFIPGAGQIYNEFGYRKIPQKKNRAWWKVPIIYGLLGTAGYYFHQYTVQSKRLKDEWIYRNDSLGTFLYSEYELWDADELLGGTDVYVYDDAGNHLLDKDGSWATKHLLGFDDAAKRRDYLIFGFAAIWGLQVIEALVDAHFVTFDVTEDLTFAWAPTMLSYSTPGVTLRLEID